MEIVRIAITLYREANGRKRPQCDACKQRGARVEDLIRKTVFDWWKCPACLATYRMTIETR